MSNTGIEQLFDLPDDSSKGELKKRLDKIKDMLLRLPEGTQYLIKESIRREELSAPTDPDIGALYLVAGTGERAPGSRKGPGYIRAKPVITFLGRPLIKWQLDVIRNLGFDKMILVGRLKENRQQTKKVVGYGQFHNVKIRYTPSKFDLYKTGSADATRNAIVHFKNEGPDFLKKYSLIIPCDQIFDLDLQLMKETHISNNATLTLAVEKIKVSNIVNTYGLILSDTENKAIVKDFLEKPDIETIAGRLNCSVEDAAEREEPISAGIYFITTEEYLDLTHSQAFNHLYDSIRDRDQEKFHGIDFGKHFLPWLLEQGKIIATSPVKELGDLGNPIRYIETLENALKNRYKSIHHLAVDNIFDETNNVWIDHETIDWRYCDLTLRERIEKGFVRLKNTRIGKFTKIEGTEAYPVVIENSDIGNEAEIYEGVEIHSSQVSRGSYIGNFASISKSYIGVECGIDGSFPEYRTKIQNYTTLADEVRIYPGVHLINNQRIGPKLHITPEYRIPEHADVANCDLLEQYKMS